MTSSRLRIAREKQGVTLRAASRATRISERILEALENDAPTDLHPSYESSLRRAYGRYLGVRLTEDKRPKKPSISRSMRTHRTVATTSVLRNGLIALALIMILGYGLWQALQLFSAPRLVVSSPPHDLVTRDSSVEIIGKTSPGAEVFVNNQTVNIEPDGNFSYHLLLRKGANDVEIVAINNLAKKATVKRTVVRDLGH